MMFLLFTAAALAGPGTFLPDAALEPAGGSVSTSAWSALGVPEKGVPNTRVTVMGVVGGNWNVNSRLQLGLHSSLMDGEDLWVSAIHARYRFETKSEISVAPWLVVGGGFSGRLDMAVLPLGIVGIAFEGGWERVRLDLSVPALGWMLVWPIPFAIVGTEAGVSFRLDTAGTHHLRAGFATLSPLLTYKYLGKRFTGAATVGLPLLVLGAGRIGGGSFVGGVRLGVRI